MALGTHNSYPGWCHTRVWTYTHTHTHSSFAHKLSHKPCWTV